MKVKKRVARWQLCLATAFLLTTGCFFPGPCGGNLVCVDWLETVGRDYSKPLIEGTDGSTLEAALKVNVLKKQELGAAELSWLREKYGSRDLTFETRRIKRRVYDIVTVKLSTPEMRRIYFDVSRQRFDWPRQ